MKESCYQVPAKEIPLFGSYDVVVCGGGPSGMAAALSARRQGLSVLVIESQGQLGGMGTSGLVAHWLGGRSKDCSKWVVGGIFQEMSEEAAALGFAVIPEAQADEEYQPHGWHLGLKHGIPFDPFMMAAYLDRKLSDAGVDVLFFTQAVDVIVEDGRISHIVIANKAGLSCVAAKTVIDATGDADIASLSGCEVCKGRNDDNLMTPVTLMFHVDNVDQDVLSDYILDHDSPRFRDDILKLREAGKWPFPYEIFISVQLNEKGTMMINTSRICGVDGTDPKSVSQGMATGRKETIQLLETMREHFPGFAGARLKAVAPLLGVRETRRIVGEFVLTIKDLAQGTQFSDTIGWSSYGWDLPDPKKPSCQPMTENQAPKSEYTPIPYRIMVPQPVSNLICPGRAVSVERDVLGPLRVMAPCMAMGEAAGVAAKQLVDGSCSSFRDVSIEELQTALLRQNALLKTKEF